MTHVMPGRVTRAPPPQVQMEKNSTTPSTRRPQSTSFHRAQRGPAAAFSSSSQETRGLCYPCDIPVLYGLWLPPMALSRRLSWTRAAGRSRQVVKAISPSTTAEAGMVGARVRTVWGPSC